MKLENARKLVKPELNIDETKARHVIVEPDEDLDLRPLDSIVEEDQKVIKVSRKSSLPTEKPSSKSSTKIDWKPSAKLRKKDGQVVITSRYKTNVYSLRSKAASNNIEENDVEHSTPKSLRAVRYQEHKYSKYVPKVPNKLQDNVSTTKSPLADKPRKMFTPRKNEKSTVEDIKAVALKLRKSLESMEKSQTIRPPRRTDTLEGGSTTLLTTMRTVKSFSFSTRLVKMDESEASSSSTSKMIDEDLVPTSTSSSFVTEIVTRNPLENEVSSPGYTVTSSAPTTSTDDLQLNEIEENSSRIISGSTRSEYRPRAAALTYDSGSPVYVVYPSATEKSSIAITPKQPQQQQQSDKEGSAKQSPVISVKVSDSDNSSSNVFSPVESAAILSTGNETILETLRSTVAPLLSTLGAKTPVFSGVYKNTNSAVSLNYLFSFFNFFFREFSNILI